MITQENSISNNERTTRFIPDLETAARRQFALQDDEN